MSNVAINWAIQQALQAPEKPVLLALANRANNKGIAFPGMRSMAFDLGISERTVSRAIKRLEEKGLITRKLQHNRKGQYPHNSYTLNMVVILSGDKLSDDNLSGDQLSGDSLSDDNLTLSGDNLSKIGRQDVLLNIIEPTITQQAKKDDLFSQIVDVFHELLPDLPNVKALSSRRLTLLKQLMAKHPKAQQLEWWKEYFAVVQASSLLMGRRPNATWKANFEWLINYNNMLKVIEGHYGQ